MNDKFSIICIPFSLCFQTKRSTLSGTSKQGTGDQEVWYRRGRCQTPAVSALLKVVGSAEAPLFHGFCEFSVNDHLDLASKCSCCISEFGHVTFDSTLFEYPRGIPLAWNKQLPFPHRWYRLCGASQLFLISACQVSLNSASVSWALPFTFLKLNQ